MSIPIDSARVRVDAVCASLTRAVYIIDTVESAPVFVLDVRDSGFRYCFHKQPRFALDRQIWRLYAGLLTASEAVFIAHLCVNAEQAKHLAICDMLHTTCSFITCNTLCAR